MSAVISQCGRYRYTLHRKIPQAVRWNRPCLFVMLNPSTADAEQDDPTIRRCLGFAERALCTSLTVVNLFALRSTDPKMLLIDTDPIGPDNDRHIKEQVAAHRNGIMVAAWGAHRIDVFREMDVYNFGHPNWVCLGRTKLGHPKHPLYLRADSPMKEFLYDK